MNKILILAVLLINLTTIQGMVSKDINVDLLETDTIRENLKKNGFSYLADNTNFLGDIKNKTDIIAVFTEVTVAADNYQASYKERTKAALLRCVLKDPEPSIEFLIEIGELK
ncbi:MAG TPA: hypothetical protein VHO47_02675 [Candidatus Babeliales bacterium]|nr:hypothetical protein [Candidatus Babeliales bacterium]